MKKFLLFLLALPLLATTCQKDPKKGQPIYVTEVEKLPAITHQGLNTFGCLVNGKAWLPDNDGTAYPALSPDYWHGQLSIRAVRFGKNSEGKRSILEGIGVDVSSSGNLYSHQKYTETKYARISLSDYKTGCDYYDSTNVLNIEVDVVHLDTIKRIIAGTFETTYYIDSICDTVKITKGRFDVKY